MEKIKRIRSGGQTGVDRAALDTAKEYGIPVGGWCPKGGWAEDCPAPVGGSPEASPVYALPGVRTHYPELCETPLATPAQRTVWNVRDADATLIIAPACESWSPYAKRESGSPGTELTEKTASIFNKPCLKISSPSDAPAVIEWLSSLGNELDLNIAGPRAGEWAEGYERCAAILRILFDQFI